VLISGPGLILAYMNFFQVAEPLLPVIGVPQWFPSVPLPGSTSDEIHAVLAATNLPPLEGQVLSLEISKVSLRSPLAFSPPGSSVNSVPAHGHVNAPRG